MKTDKILLIASIIFAFFFALLMVVAVQWQHAEKELTQKRNNRQMDHVLFGAGLEDSMVNIAEVIEEGGDSARINGELASLYRDTAQRFDRTWKEAARLQNSSPVSTRPPEWYLQKATELQAAHPPVANEEPNPDGPVRRIILP